MPPVPGATSKYPSPTFHLAGPPSAACHLERSAPPDNTIASDGGRRGRSCVLDSPGVMTGGCGRLRSWIFHCCSAAEAPLGPALRALRMANTIVAATAALTQVRMVLCIGMSPLFGLSCGSQYQRP